MLSVLCGSVSFRMQPVGGGVETFEWYLVKIQQSFELQPR